MIPPATKHRVSGIASASLLHFDGTNGATTFPDVYTNTWTAHGSAQLSTAQFKFGTASLLLNGSTDWISAPSAHFVLGSGNWTFESFIRTAAIGSLQGIFGKRATTGIFAGAELYIDTSGKIGVLVTDSGSNWNISNLGTTVLSTSTWYHVAFVRNSSNFSMYLNGTAEINVTQTVGSITDNGDAQVIGASAVNGGFPFGGNIDESRISLVARYTSNFTPPSAPFTF